MKYGTLTLGQIEALVNKLGGMNGVQKFLAGELIVASPVTSVESIITPTFTYDKTKDGWKLVTHVIEGVIDIKKFKLVSFLRGGESYINGEEMVRRAKEMECGFGQTTAEYFLIHQDEIPKDFRKYYLVFPGTVWRDPGGRRVPYLDWGGDRWYLGFGWLGGDWSGRVRLLRASS